MQCNIDRRGRMVRLAVGGVVEFAGFVLIALALMGIVEGTWPWVAGVALMLGGSFMILEGMLGWCAVRAMGMKTPL